MTKRVGRIELVPEPLPYFYTHAEWCTWLWTRGCLSPRHRACRVNDHCVAHNAIGTGEPWRYVKKAN